MKMDTVSLKNASILDKEIKTIFKRLIKEKKVPIDKTDISYSELFSNKMLIIYLIRAGIPYSLFNLIQVNTPFSEKDWAGLLDLSTKSMQRYKNSSAVFKSVQSEKILEMAEVAALGLEVFGDMNRFKLWLNTPNFALGKAKPIELLKDSYGKELIIGELIRISYGILA